MTALHSKMVVTHPYSEDDVSTLRMLFPHLDRPDAIAILRTAGDVGRAASQLVDVEVVDVDEGRELPAHLKCPKCFSADIFLEDRTQVVVCLSCHHHFSEDKAKKGRVQAVGGGQASTRLSRQHNSSAKNSKGSGGSSAKQKLQKQQQQQHSKNGRKGSPVRAAAATTSPAVEPSLPDATVLSSPEQQQLAEQSSFDQPPVDSVLEACAAVDATETPGPVLQRLHDTRAKRAEKPTLRLVVSHASAPNQQRVITVPRDGGFTSLLKQARAKFRLRKPLKGVRMLPEGSPVATLDSVPNGAEVLVTYNSEFVKEARTVASPLVDDIDTAACENNSDEAEGAPVSAEE